MQRHDLGSLVFVLLAVAACGGNVVVDGDGQGTSTTGGTGGANLCGPACSALASKGCADGTCAAACQTALAGPCVEAAITLLDCLRDEVASAPGCFVDACAPARDALQACASAATCTSPLMGSGGPGMCVGKGICDGVERATTCDESGSCTCLFEGTVGTCQETGPYLCDFFDGCCAKLFPMGG